MSTHRRPTLTEQLDELRAELRQDPIIDWHYLRSAEARRHAAGAAAVALLCFVVSYLIAPE